MRRRELVCLLGGGASGFFWSVPARTEQSSKSRIIGYFASDPSVLTLWTAAFVERLRELGWIEGRTVARAWRSDLFPSACCRSEKLSNDSDRAAYAPAFACAIDGGNGK
jgi:hypothetical protein